MNKHLWILIILLGGVVEPAVAKDQVFELCLRDTGEPSVSFVIPVISDHTSTTPKIFGSDLTQVLFPVKATLADFCEIRSYESFRKLSGVVDVAFNYYNSPSSIYFFDYTLKDFPQERNSLYRVLLQLQTLRLTLANHLLGAIWQRGE